MDQSTGRSRLVCRLAAAGGRFRVGLAVLAGSLVLLVAACGPDDSGRADLLSAATPTVPPEPAPTSTAPRTPFTPQGPSSVVSTPEPISCPMDRYTAPAEVPPWPPYARPALTYDPGLRAIFDQYVPQDGRASVTVFDLTGGRYAEVWGDRVWYSASLYKVPLLVEALWQEEQGLLDTTRIATLGEPYIEEDLGTLEFLEVEPCGEVSVREAMRYMTVASDNGMAHLVRDFVGTRHVERHLRSMGLQQTVVGSTGLTTTANDMAQLFASLVRGYPSSSVGNGAWRMLMDQWVRLRIPAGITDPTATVANKTGDWEGASHDVAIVHNDLAVYVLAILTDGSLPLEFFTSVTAAVHTYLTAPAAPVPPPAASPTATPATAPSPAATPTPAPAPPTPTATATVTATPAATATPTPLPGGAAE